MTKTTGNKTNFRDFILTPIQMKLLHFLNDYFPTGPVARLDPAPLWFLNINRICTETNAVSWRLNNKAWFKKRITFRRHFVWILFLFNIKTPQKEQVFDPERRGCRGGAVMASSQGTVCVCIVCSFHSRFLIFQTFQRRRNNFWSLPENKK